MASKAFASAGTTQPSVTYAANARVSQCLVSLNPAVANPAGTLQFSSPSVSVNEPDGSVVLQVSRVGGSTGAVGVGYASADGTAAAGADYTSTSGTLAWASGDSADKTITVPIINDTASETSETFTITLSSPTGGAVLGAAAAATVTIVDDEAPPPPVQVPAGKALFMGLVASGMVLYRTWKGKRPGDR